MGGKKKKKKKSTGINREDLSREVAFDQRPEVTESDIHLVEKRVFREAAAKALSRLQWCFIPY